MLLQLLCLGLAVHALDPSGLVSYFTDTECSTAPVTVENAAGLCQGTATGTVSFFLTCGVDATGAATPESLTWCTSGNCAAGTCTPFPILGVGCFRAPAGFSEFFDAASFTASCFADPRLPPPPAPGGAQISYFSLPACDVEGAEAAVSAVDTLDGTCIPTGETAWLLSCAASAWTFFDNPLCTFNANSVITPIISDRCIPCTSSTPSPLYPTPALNLIPTTRSLCPGLGRCVTGTALSLFLARAEANAFKTLDPQLQAGR